jgi:hypothetical protein
MKHRKEPIGFFYNVILQESGIPVIHAGLVMISKNTGLDLLARPYVYMALLQRKKYGSFYFTNISSTPSIVGTFAELFTEVWPSHKSKSLVKPPHSDYKNVVKLLYNSYILPYFPEQNLGLDLKRFTITSSSNAMGFDTNLRNLSRHSSLGANIFCNFWIDYTKGEDLIQVGWVGKRCTLKHNALLAFNKVKEGASFAFQALQAKTESKSKNRIGIEPKILIKHPSVDSSLSHVSETVASKQASMNENALNEKQINANSPIMSDLQN